MRLVFPYSNEHNVVRLVRKITQNYLEEHPGPCKAVIGGGTTLLSILHEGMERCEAVDTNPVQVNNFQVSRKLIKGSKSLEELVSLESGGFDGEKRNPKIVRRAFSLLGKELFPLYVKRMRSGVLYGCKWCEWGCGKHIPSVFEAYPLYSDQKQYHITKKVLDRVSVKEEDVRKGDEKYAFMYLSNVVDHIYPPTTIIDALRQLERPGLAICLTIFPKKAPDLKNLLEREGFKVIFPQKSGKERQECTRKGIVIPAYLPFVVSNGQPEPEMKEQLI
ncbi:MAG TPA: hypothetical protein ENF51_00690 [Candidatus Aenigmarchaeota archaeon]|nr:hypothetical protein [Candidatus Aenigmarchaeota archaeon]